MSAHSTLIHNFPASRRHIRSIEQRRDLCTSCTTQRHCIVMCSVKNSCLTISTKRAVYNQLYKPGSARTSLHRKQMTVYSALPLHELSVALSEESPVWTLDQIAGLAFGGLMLASVLLATKVDVIIARAQRRDLGLCESCGGLYDADLCNNGQCPAKAKR